VAAALAAADIGVSPLEANPFTEISLPTKALEYSAMGKPSVVADTIAAREHFRPGDVAWYAPGDDASFATAILRLVDDADFRTAAASAAQARAAELSWDREAPFYVAIIRALANRTPVPPPA
jgi:glycosyltransferase involved in cell wall biosynthesis